MLHVHHSTARRQRNHLLLVRRLLHWSGLCGCIVLLLLVRLLGTTTTVHAILYGTSGSHGRPSQLYQIMPNGRATLISNRITVNGRPVSINGLAFDRTNRVNGGGQMYAFISPYSTHYANSLIRLNVANGIGTLVGVDDSGTIPGMADLAIDNFGAVYGMYRGTNPSNPIDDLAKFDLDSGNAQLFGDAGDSVALSDAFGMDFDRVDNDNLHLINFVNGTTAYYYTLSTATGWATPVRTITNAPFACRHGSINPDGIGIFGAEYWCVEVLDEPNGGGDGSGGVNLNTRIQVIWLPFGSIMTTIQTQVTDLTTLAFTFDTTSVPSAAPSEAPSSRPSQRPSGRPSTSPSIRPTDRPSPSPSVRPSRDPTSSPTERPSTRPSVQPSHPTDRPSQSPSERPSRLPTNTSALSSILPYGSLIGLLEIMYKLFG